MSIDHPEAKPTVNTPSAEQLSQIPVIDVPENASEFVDGDTDRINPQLASKPETEHTGFRAFLDKPIGKIAVVGTSIVTAATVIGGIVYGVTSANNAPKPQQTNGAEPNPSTTPDILPSETPVVEAEPRDSDWVNPSEEAIPASLEKYRDMSIDEFAALPSSEQRTYLAWMMRDSKDYQTMYSYVSGNEFDQLKTDVTVNSDGQDAYTSALYAVRLAFSVKGDDRYKVLISALDGGQSSNLYAGFKEALDNNQDGLFPRILAASAAIENNYVISSTENLTDEEGNTYKDVVTRNLQGELVTNRLYFFSVEVEGEEAFNQWASQGRIG
jgi:hypothetical protein